MKVYLDNGATTKVDPNVVRAMKPYFLTIYGNASSLHKFGRDAKEALDNARSTIAKKINAYFEEIVFTSGGSESNNLAIKGIAYNYKDKGNHIITTKVEHPSVLETFKNLEKEGFKVDYLDVDELGLVDLNQLKKLINKKTILVSVIHGNNETGVIQDIKKIGEICNENEVLFHIDAVQSFTKVPIDVKNLNVDLMSISSHKIHGPKGVGALYFNKNIKLKKLNYGGHHEFNLRAGTENIPGIVGFAKAIELLKNTDINKMTGLRNYLIRELSKIENTQINGSLNSRLCNNVNISFKGIEGESILLHLDLRGIAVSTGSACSSQSLEPSHVLIAMGLSHEMAHGSIRFTLSKYTKKEELDYTIRHVKSIVENLRRISPL